MRQHMHNRTQKNVNGKTNSENGMVIPAECHQCVWLLEFGMTSPLLIESQLGIIATHLHT